MKKAPMKKIWNTLFFAFFILCLFLFKPREDMVFAAINKSQSIQLFENDKDFVLFIEDDNTYTGTYWISMDTVFLSYRDHIDLSTNILPSKLFINMDASNIKSTEGYSFSAEIYLDTRQKSYNAATNTVRKLNHREVRIFALGEQK
jgi:hypothetical protein